MPCQNFVNYAQDVKVLIYESTLDQGMEEEALRKKHSTSHQALQVATKCRAWRTILTHFSMRYVKIGLVPQKHLENQILIAFDHMRLSIS